jgi:hypothetical protein
MHPSVRTSQTRRYRRFVVLGDQRATTDPPDPAALVLTCANCGAQMDERKCKLICSCGYFASCSDY